MSRQLWLVAPLVLGMVSVSHWATAAEAGGNAQDEIRAIFTRLDQAINAHALKGVMATYAPDGRSVLLGTGEGERWVGAEIEKVYQGFFKEFDPGTQDTRCTWTLQDVRGDLAWIATMCQVNDFFKNQKREYGINLTAVLEKLDGQWRFRVMHFSTASSEETPVPEEEVAR